MIRFICSVFDCGNTISDLLQYKYINNFLDSVNMTTVFFDFLIYSQLLSIKDKPEKENNKEWEGSGSRTKLIKQQLPPIRMNSGSCVCIKKIDIDF